MATLDSLTNVSQSKAPVSTAIASGGQQVNKQNYQVGSKLADDLLTAMKVDNNSINQMLDVSEDIATRVASDNSTELALYISKQRETTNFNNPSELAELEKNIEAKQLELGNKNFILPNAQEAYDKAYSVPTAKSTAVMRSELKIKEHEINREVEQNHTLAALNIEQNNKLTPSGEALETAVSKWTGGDPTKVHKGWYEVAKTSTKPFNHRVKTDLMGLLKAGGWTKDIGFSSAVKSNIFKNEFTGYGKLLENGEISFSDRVQGTQAQDEVRNSWEKFISDVDGGDGSLYNADFKKNTTVTRTASADVKPSSMSSERMQKQIDILENQANIARNKLPTTDADEKAFDEAIGAYKNIKIEREYMEDSLNIDLKVSNGSVTYNVNAVSDFQKYQVNGRDVTYTDAINGRKISKHISANEHDTMYKAELTKIDEVINSIDVSTTEGDKAFLINLNKLKELEVVGAGKSLTSAKYNNVLNGNEQIKYMDSNSVRQYLLYEDYTIKTNHSRQKDGNTLRTLNRTISAIDNEYKKKKDGFGSVEHQNAISTAAYSFLSNEKKIRRGNYNEPLLRETIKATVAELASGDLNWSEMSTATLSSSAVDAVQKYIVDTGQTDVAESAIGKLETFDYGKALALTRTDMRAINPKGLTDSDTSNAIDTVLKNYNKRNTQSYDKSEITLRIENDDSNKHFKVGVYLSNDTSIWLGEVTEANGLAAAELGKD